MKLHVYLRNAGLASRRKAEEYIAAGRVSVDGKPGTIGQIVEGDELIRVDGRILRTSFQGSKYYIVNKPVGITSTTAYFPNEKNVIDMLPRAERLKPWQIAGRLDRNSQGLMLVTNDGNAVLVLTHPRYQVKKVYEVTLNESLMPKDIAHLKEGVGDYKFSNVRKLGGDATYEVTLQEGKKREIREAFKLIGTRVIVLKRLTLGPLSIVGTPEGTVRLLEKDEIADLQTFLENKAPSVYKRASRQVA